MSTLPPDARVLFRDEAIVLAVWSNLVITDLRGATGRDQIAEIVKAYRSLQTIHPNGLVAMTLIPQGIPVADAQTRADASKMLEAFAGVIRQISIVIEGSGIWAGTMRTVLRGMAIVARTPFGMKVHDDLPGAVRSLAPLVDQKPTETELLDVVQRLRRATGGDRSRAANGS